MENDIKDEVIIDDVEANNETEVAENTEVEEKPEAKPEKPKRTPQEEYEYHKGRAERLEKKLGLKKPEVKKDTSEPIELDYGSKAFLKTYGIQGSDELALVKSFQSRTGDDLDTIVSDDIFLGKLNALRDARESQNAIPKGKPRSGQTAVTDVDIAFAKFKESGELPSDFETRNKVVDRISAEEKGPMFNFK